MNNLISRVWRFFLNLLFKQTVLMLLLLFATGMGVALANMSSLSTSLIQSQALISTELQAQSIIDAWKLYSSSAAGRVNKVKGVSITHDYLVKDGAIPWPATFAIKLSKKASEKQNGLAVRLYSDYPYPWRKAEGGSRDDFEKKALSYLREHPEERKFSPLSKKMVLACGDMGRSFAWRLVV